MQHIKKPTLLIDRTKAVKNIVEMKRKADRSNVVLRPHFKTHQSAEVGEWFRAAGIHKITVSSVEMACYFAENGWKDITIAFPLNTRELDDIIKLNEKVELSVLISSVNQLKNLNSRVKRPIRYFIKIDVGYHRSGLEVTQLNEIQKIIDLGNNKLIFKGLVSHFGDTYQAKSRNEIQGIYDSGIKSLIELKNQLIYDSEILISIGDTPSCSLVEEFKGIDEIRPGNFVYYDLMQKQLGSCSHKQISAIVACPVIDVYPQRKEVLIYAGAVHLSKEYIIDSKGNKTFGELVYLNGNEWSKSIPDAYIKSLSQEHGIISCNVELLSNLKIGDLIGVVPVHSCLAADLLKEIFIIDL